MLEDSLCPAAHSALQNFRDLQTSEAFISKTFDLNDIKFGRVVKNSIFYNKSRVWTWSS